MNDEGYKLSFLAPFSQRYYRRMGYEQAENTFTYKLKSSVAHFFKVKSNGKIVQCSLSETLPVLMLFYAQKIASQSGKLQRSQWWWHYLTLKNKWEVAFYYEKD